MDRTSNITKAIALKYGKSNSNDSVIVATGKGLEAENILLEAIKNGVQVYKDEELLDKVSNLNSMISLQGEIYPVIKNVSKYLEDIDKKSND